MIEKVEVVEQATKEIQDIRKDKEVLGDHLVNLYIENVVAGAKFKLVKLGIKDDVIDKIKWEDL